MSAISDQDLLEIRNEVIARIPRDQAKSYALFTNNTFMGIVDGLDPSLPCRYRTRGEADAKQQQALAMIDFVNAM